MIESERVENRGKENSRTFLMKRKMRREQIIIRKHVFDVRE